MLFNSFDFAIFLPIIFILYWFVFNKNLRVQNFLIVIASYVFYGWWDWRFLLLIIFSSGVDFIIGIGLVRYSGKRKRKLLLSASILVNIGFLGFFKYFNFFIQSFIEAFTFFGETIDTIQLNIVLPVGISFYTFQTLSYSIDVYRKKLEPTKNIISFFAFVSFFPQLVAGPIERATNLLPQFYRKRIFDYQNAVDGMRQILWGLFKKMVIADNCAEFANYAFNNSPEHSGSTLLLGAVLFSFQIYGDFSGYSDIAIGTSRLFGFNLMRNFAFPYFSRDIAEFWRRWHISLSSWFKDYVYIPLGGSKVRKIINIRNTFIIFLVSGFWHGANWTFIVWGLLNAIYFLPLSLLKRNRKNIEIVAFDKYFPSLADTLKIILTYLLTVFAWIFFRADSISHALQYIAGIFNITIFNTPDKNANEIITLVLLFMIIEWFGRKHEFAISGCVKLNKYLQWCIYIIVMLAIFVFSGKHQEFIYFQF